MDRLKKHSSNSSDKSHESFCLPWQLYLFITVYWWLVFSGIANEFFNSHSGALIEIVGFIFIIFMLPVLLFSIITASEILDFLGYGKTKLIEVATQQDSINPVHAKAQTFVSNKNFNTLEHSIKNDKSNFTTLQKITPLEDLFKAPRKINWDELNNTRKINGNLGEQFVYNLEKDYLIKIGRSDLADNVQHVAKEGDGHGYDIKSFFDNGSVKYIEVKATNSLTGSTFNLSRNEFHFLQSNLNNTFIYHVHNVNNEQEATMVVYSASKVIESPNISPSGYVVKM